MINSYKKFQIWKLTNLESIKQMDAGDIYILIVSRENLYSVSVNYFLCKSITEERDIDYLSIQAYENTYLNFDKYNVYSLSKEILLSNATYIGEVTDKEDISEIDATLLNHFLLVSNPSFIEEKPKLISVNTTPVLPVKKEEKKEVILRKRMASKQETIENIGKDIRDFVEKNFEVTDDNTVYMKYEELYDMFIVGKPYLAPRTFVQAYNKAYPENFSRKRVPVENGEMKQIAVIIGLILKDTIQEEIPEKQEEIETIDELEFLKRKFEGSSREERLKMLESNVDSTYFPTDIQGKTWSLLKAINFLEDTLTLSKRKIAFKYDIKKDTINTTVSLVKAKLGIGESHFAFNVY